MTSKRSTTRTKKKKIHHQLTSNPAPLALRFRFTGNGFSRSRSALNAELSRLQEENENLRHRLSTYAANEEFSRKSIAELNEEHEQKLFTLRLDYETKIEQLSVKTSEHQIEMFTLRQMYETMLDEKRHADQQINEMRLREQTSQEKLDRSQIECERFRKLSQRPPMTNALTQTVRCSDI